MEEAIRVAVAKAMRDRTIKERIRLDRIERRIEALESARRYVTPETWQIDRSGPT